MEPRLVGVLMAPQAIVVIHQTFRCDRLVVDGAGRGRPEAAGWLRRVDQVSGSSRRRHCQPGWQPPGKQAAGGREAARGCIRPQLRPTNRRSSPSVGQIGDNRQHRKQRMQKQRQRPSQATCGQLRKPLDLHEGKA